MQQGSGLAIRGDTRAVHGILLDLERVVYVRDTLLPGSLDAISRIQAAGIPLKFITNTTRRPRRRIAGISPGWDFERRWTISTRPQLSLGTFSPIEI